MKPDKNNRLRFYAVLGFVGFAIIAASGVYLAYIGELSQSRRPPTCTSTPCVEGALIGLAGFVLVFVAVRGFIGSLFTAGYLQKHPKSIPQIGSGAEDEKILFIANELLDQVRIRIFHSVEMLAWAEDISWHECRFKRQGFRKPHQLVLPSRLRGMLESEDWRTLLTYYFLQYKPPRGIPVLLRSFFWLALPFLVLVLVAFGILEVYGLYTEQLFLSILGPPIGLLSLIRTFPWMKKVFLKQDGLIAQSLGRDALLTILKRIDWLRLPEVENGKRRDGWIARLWPMPNITERIDNLQSWISAQ